MNIFYRHHDICAGLYLTAQCEVILEHLSAHATVKSNYTQSVKAPDGFWHDPLLAQAEQNCMIGNYDNYGFKDFMAMNPEIMLLQVNLNGKVVSQFGRLAKSEPPAISINSAKMNSWRSSLDKGITLCHNNLHEGDAKTLKEILEFVSAFENHD